MHAPSSGGARRREEATLAGEAPTFKSALDGYAELESEIRTMISGLFGEVCALCTSSCCTPDICEESEYSAFLRAVRVAHGKPSAFCDRFGWLTERGCGLTVGRPPVCYGFFCNEILDSMQERERIILRVLGRLLSWVGERAAGTRHLVEFGDDASLSEINASRLIERIGVARTALLGVKSAFNTERLSLEQQDAVRRVSPSAEFDA